MPTPRLPGVTRTQPVTTASESIGARGRSIADQAGWVVNTAANPYWPGDYRLSSTPMALDVNHVYMLPYPKLDRDYEVEYVRYSVNKSSAATNMTVGVYELTGRTSLQLRMSTVCPLTAVGAVTHKMSTKFTFRKDTQYFIAVLITGTINSSGPQIAISHMAAIPLVAVQEPSKNGVMPASVVMGTAETEAVHEFPAFMFMNDLAEQYLGEGIPEGMASYGSMYISSSATTTVVTTGTAVKIAGTTTAGDLKDFTMPANNRLTFVGASSKEVAVVASITTTKSDAGNDWIEVKLAKNGTTVAGSTIRREHVGATDIGSMAISWIVSVDPNDYLEVYLDREAANGSDTVTAQYMTVIVHD